LMTQDGPNAVPPAKGVVHDGARRGSHANAGSLESELEVGVLAGLKIGSWTEVLIQEPDPFEDRSPESDIGRHPIPSRRSLPVIGDGIVDRIGRHERGTISWTSAGRCGGKERATHEHHVGLLVEAAADGRQPVGGRFAVVIDQGDHVAGRGAECGIPCLAGASLVDVNPSNALVAAGSRHRGRLNRVGVALADHQEFPVRSGLTKDRPDGVADCGCSRRGHANGELHPVT